MTHDKTQELLAKLKRGAEIGRRIEVMRPTKATLGTQLYRYIGCFEETLRLAISAQAKIEGDRSGHDNDFDRDAWRPVSNSPASDERRILADAGWPSEFLSHNWHQDFSRTLSVARRLTETASDNLKATSILFASPEIVRGPLVLSRAVLDASAHSFYLFEPGIDPAQRFIRALNEELNLSAASYKIAKREGNADEASAFEEESRGIENILVDRGYTEFVRTGGTGTYRPIVSIGSDVPTTRMIDLILDSPGPIWNDLSAIVHNQEDMGFRILFGLDSSGRSPNRDSFIAMQVLPALLAFIYARTRLAAYTGWECAGLSDEEEALLTLWTYGSGMRDDEYRKIVEKGG
jgi:hypothetical protein